MLILPKHAQRCSAERPIRLAWVGATVDAADRVASDTRDPAATHSFRAIPGAGGRVLKVVHKPSGDDVMAVATNLDQGATP